MYPLFASILAHYMMLRTLMRGEPVIFGRSVVDSTAKRSMEAHVTQDSALGKFGSGWLA